MTQTRPQPSSKSSFIVFLGRESAIAMAELTAYVSLQTNAKPPQLILDNIALLADYSGSIEDLAAQLAGVVKIAKVEKTLPNPIDEMRFLTAIEDFVLQSIATKSSKVVFSISLLGLKQLQITLHQLQQAIKDLIKQHDLAAKFIASSSQGLTAVQFRNYGVARKGFELLLIGNEQIIYFAQTIWVQEFELWIKHDYGRPYADAKKGMLPPKLAKMMINIALCRFSAQSSPKQNPKTLCDPFCGLGTVLQEALPLGLQVFGSDIDGDVVTKAKANIDWFMKQSFFASHATKGTVGGIFQSDVAKVDRVIRPRSIDIIVTEPYLGPPMRLPVNQKIIQQVTAAYTKNFLAFFQKATLLQPPGGIVAIVVPRMQTGKFSQLLIEKNVLDSCEKFGYTLDVRPLHYARPDAIIGREIYFFKKRS